MSLSTTGNQLVQPNRIATWTDEELVSPVTPADAAAYIVVASDDPLLPGILLAATEAVQRFTNVQLCRRAWTWRADRYPEREPALLGVGGMPALAQWWLEMPAWPLVSVESVTADSYTVDIPTSRVFVTRPEAPLVIEYTAGYATADVPAIYLEAIKQLAAYLYEHRGECDAAEAGRKSGAFGQLAGVKRYVGGL